MSGNGAKPEEFDRPPSPIALQAGSKTQPKWPLGLADIYDVTLACIQRNSRPREPTELATSLVLAIAEYFGGRLFYIPKGEAMKIALRNREIYSRMGRETAAELAAEYKIGVIHIYRIAREQRALRKKKVPQE